MPRMTLARCPRCSFHHRTRQPAPMTPRTRFSALVKMTPELLCAKCASYARKTAKRLAQESVGRAVGEELARFYTCQ